MATHKGGKKGKRPDTRPARARYWSKKSLQKKKVKNLLAHNGFDDEHKARVFWLDARKTRVKK